MLRHAAIAAMITLSQAAYVIIAITIRHADTLMAKGHTELMILLSIAADDIAAAITLTLIRRRHG